MLVDPAVTGVEITTAMIDRLVHHAEVIALKGDSYRLKDRDLRRVPAPAE
jgi:DNA replication protein DnaC